MKLDRRRDFIAKARNLLAAGGLAGQVERNAFASETDPRPGAGIDYYDKAWRRQNYQCTAGTYTAMTASIMPPSVQAAVAIAAKHPVLLAELAEKMQANIWRANWKVHEAAMRDAMAHRRV